MGETIEKRLTDLGVTLPAAAAPAANYVPYARSGKLLFTAGQLPLKDGKLQAAGLLGRDLDTAAGREGGKALRDQHPGTGQGGDRRPREDCPRGQDHRLRRLDRRISPSSIWSPTARRTSWSPRSANAASMRARRSAWRRCRSTPPVEVEAIVEVA